ncbi:ParB/RepB/Spo0J family partition protein [Noviherbaspirillum suwonense]|jgi:ParB family chromosome partitioning protein|uniref:ParB family protein n=1 Tax=Noviherbaspirillum suwonense TaxID=1224511 RepID=A0ABY1QTK5_9BURK|nr:ParB/RepB/Spo0J family partition protein [Noviherbaspirillum suwonense]SMP80527.1 ParB family protein [Noviherbaspirillum suwonense]
MSGKPDRKSLLRSSIRNETAAVEKRYEPANVDKRYDAADTALAGRPLGLVGPTVSKAKTASDFSAEIGAAAQGNDKAIVRIPLSMVHDNPLNARHIYDPKAVKALAASIATRGQLVPAPAARHPTLSGHVVLIDGHYRKRALLAAGKSDIECVLQEVGSDLDMYRMSYLINEERNAQSPLDNALAWQKLLVEQKIADGAGIAELTGLSTAAVAKTMSFLKLPEVALARLRETPAKFGIAVGYEIYQLSKLLSEKELLELMQRTVDEDLSSRALESLRGQLENAKPRKKKEVSRQYRIKVGKTQIGFIKEWDSGRVALDINMADPKEREALVEELKRRFQIGDLA